MKNKYITELADAVLNTSGVREVLRQKVPLIDRLESLDSLGYLRLTKMNMGEENFILTLAYEGVASADIYPHVRANLIKQGVVKAEDTISTKRENSGQPNEYESIHLGTSGNSTHIVLNAYNPNYQK